MTDRPFNHKVEGANYFDIERQPTVGDQSLIGYDDGNQIKGFNRERGRPFPPYFRQAHRGADRLVWADRNEYQGGTRGRLRRVSKRHVHKAAKNIGGLG